MCRASMLLLIEFRATTTRPDTSIKSELTATSLIVRLPGIGSRVAQSKGQQNRVQKRSLLARLSVRLALSFPSNVPRRLSRDIRVVRVDNQNASCRRDRSKTPNSDAA